MLERISEGVKNRKLEGISGAIDLTDRHNGTRLVIEIKTGFDPNAVLAQLFRHTPLQDNFTMNNVALVDGLPHTMGLKGDAAGVDRPPPHRGAPSQRIPPPEGA